MTNIEIIDRLCGITTELAEIVYAQQQIIEQSNLAGEGIDELNEKIRLITDSMDVTEYNSRHLCNIDREELYVSTKEN